MNRENDRIVEISGTEKIDVIIDFKKCYTVHLGERCTMFADYKDLERILTVRLDRYITLGVIRGIYFTPNYDELDGLIFYNRSASPQQLAEVLDIINNFLDVVDY